MILNRRVAEVFPEYCDVQKIAKETMEYIKTEIRAGMPLSEVRRLCEEKMTMLGADSFWYWDIGAFVFAGDETTVSVSGKEYITADRVIESDDIITIDLSPQIGDTWGDYARTIIIEKGNNMKLGDVSYFTFEPHISTDGSKYGLKREDIYYFDNEVLKKL